MRNRFTYHGWNLSTHANRLTSFQSSLLSAKLFKNLAYFGICFMASSRGMFTSTFLKVSRISLSTSSFFLLVVAGFVVFFTLVVFALLLFRDFVFVVVLVFLDLLLAFFVVVFLVTGFLTTFFCVTFFLGVSFLLVLQLLVQS